MVIKAPASVGAVVMLGGIALVYWALIGLGVIEGGTAKQNVTGLRDKLKTRGGSV